MVNELIYHTDDLSRVLPAFERQTFAPDVLAVYESQLRASAAGWKPEDYERARDAEGTGVRTPAARCRRSHDDRHRRGGGVLYGRELELHHQAEIPAWDVLRMATSEAADMSIGCTR